MDDRNTAHGANTMDAITYLITFRYLWINPELVGNSTAPFTPVSETWTSNSYTDAVKAARNIMDGEYDDCAGFVTTIKITREGRSVKNRTAMAQLNRVSPSAVCDHPVHDRNGTWTKDAGNALDRDLTADLLAA